jgi:hypothetical protein
MSKPFDDDQNDFATYGIYGNEISIATPVEGPMQAKPLLKSEKVRMLEFFRGVSVEDSETIMSGFCPKCEKVSLRTEWVSVGMGYKQCPRCDWKDY